MGAEGDRTKSVMEGLASPKSFYESIDSVVSRLFKKAEGRVQQLKVEVEVDAKLSSGCEEGPEPACL